MQQKYLEHYVAVLFHKWLMRIADQVGDAPFRAVVQNYMYYQDHENPKKVRIQSFITGLLEYIRAVAAMEDPDPAPTLVELELDKELQAKIDAPACLPGLAPLQTITTTPA